jgi:uncharacterized protein YodC (DUF2158 family)
MLMIQVGTKVRLASDQKNPVMVVKGPATYLERGMVICQWWEDGKYKEDRFPIVSLMKVETSN